MEGYYAKESVAMLNLGRSEQIKEAGAELLYWVWFLQGALSVANA